MASSNQKLDMDFHYAKEKSGNALPLVRGEQAECGFMDAKEFGRRVYALRMKKGWTQAMCSDRAGISLRNLRMIETHRSRPKLETVEKLARTFRCGWEDLLGNL